MKSLMSPLTFLAAVAAAAAADAPCSSFREAPARRQWSADVAGIFLTHHNTAQIGTRIPRTVVLPISSCKLGSRWLSLARSALGNAANPTEEYSVSSGRHAYSLKRPRRTGLQEVSGVRVARQEADQQQCCRQSFGGSHRL